MLIVFVRPSSGNNIFLPLLRWTAVGRVHLSSCSLSGVAPFWTWTNSRAVSARRRKLEILHAPTDESATNCGAAATALLFKLSSIIRETVVTFERPMQFRFFFSSQWILWHCDIILCDCSSLAAACNGLEMQLHDACTLQISMLWINKKYFIFVPLRAHFVIMHFAGDHYHRHTTLYLNLCIYLEISFNRKFASRHVRTLFVGLSSSHRWILHTPLQVLQREEIAFQLAFDQQCLSFGKCNCLLVHSRHEGINANTFLVSINLAVWCVALA